MINEQEIPQSPEPDQTEVPDGKRRSLAETSEKRVEEKASTKSKEPEYKDDPWKRARGGPSEEWQPKAWDPNAAATKR